MIVRRLVAFGIGLGLAALLLLADEGRTQSGTTCNCGAGSSPITALIFAQPTNETGIAGNMFVPPAEGSQPPNNQWMLTLYQPNPNTGNGELVATPNPVGSLTGFAPAAPSTAQLAFVVSPTSSTAQMEGATVGAYINSADLPASPAGSKMMIAPQYDLGSPVQTFPNSSAVLSYSLELQIPTATGATTYATLDSVFTTAAGAKLEFGAKIFVYGNSTFMSGFNFNTDSSDYTAATPLGAGESWITQAAGSASTTGAVWTGYRTFAWSVSYAQFATMLQAIAAAYPTSGISTDPSQYSLAQFHLNAEFQFNPGAASLGWSMQGLTVTATRSF